MIPVHSEIISVLSGINDACYGWEADLEQTQFFPVRMQTVGLRIEGDAIGRFDLPNQTREFRGARNHISPQRNPLKSNSALVLVACRLSISFSIASRGGSAAIVLRSISTRSHSSG